MDDSARQRYETRVKALEAFGHRGSATDNEARAARYLAEQLTEIGLEPSEEAFQGSDRMGVRILLHVGVSAAGGCLLWSAPALTLLVGAVALASFVFENTTRTKLLGRPLVNKPSRNVVARIAATGGPAVRRLVVLGHYDTQRTGLIWSEGLVKRMAPLMSKSPPVLKSPLFLVLLAMTLQPVAGLGALVWPGSWLFSAAGIACLVIFAIAGGLLLQWSLSPFVPGACDNASGAAAVLAIAEAWQDDPVDGVELVALLPGCEETGLLGAAAWADQHSAELSALPTRFLNIDTLGYGRTRYIDGEHSLAGLPVRYPPDIVALCAEVAEAWGLVDAGPHSLAVATDGLALLARGIPGASVLTFEDGGYMPNYHRLTDTSDRMDFDVAWDAVQYCWALARRIAGARTGRRP